MIGRQADGNDPATFWVVAAEVTEFDLALVEVSHGALLVPVRGLDRQADADLPVWMLSEELGVEVDHFSVFHRKPDAHFLSTTSV